MSRWDPLHSWPGRTVQTRWDPAETTHAEETRRPCVGWMNEKVKGSQQSDEHSETGISKLCSSKHSNLKIPFHAA